MISLMHCPERAMLEAYEQGRLARSQTETMERHLMNCADCDACIRLTHLVHPLLLAAVKSFDDENRGYLAEPAFLRGLKELEGWPSAVRSALQVEYFHPRSRLLRANPPTSRRPRQ